MTLLVNGIRGEMSFDDAEQAAAMLVSLDRAIPADRWVQAFVERAAREANGQWLARFVG